MEKLVAKTIITAGTQEVNFVDGTRVKFHFCTKTCEGDDSKILDDSRKLGKPMELVIGKKFKMEVWEAAVKTMRLNEISSFSADKAMVTQYPFVAKTLRDINKPNSAMKLRCCAATLHSQSIGYDDLNDLITNPRDLEFIIELLEAKAPDQYEREMWQLNEKEKLDAVKYLREDGNKLYGAKEYDKAAEKYSLAVGVLEGLMLKEKPRDTEWNELNKIKVPVLLNYAQCKLINKEYYSVIEHCTTVLEADPENVKAYFRRGKAHIGAWNPEGAEADFRKVLELDPSLEKLVNKELEILNVAKKQKEIEDRKKFEGKMF